MRPLLRYSLLLPFAFLLSCSRPTSDRTDSEPVRERPAWVKQGIVMVGNWEPLTFIRRRGGQPLEDVENWKPERTEEVARKLKEAGVNLVITNLHKGFGLKTEAEDMDATRRFAGFAHRHGLRVGGYIGASMMQETFFREEPKASDWMQVDELGRPIHYNNAQTFRYVACRFNPGYDAFVKKVMRIGIEDMKLDLIHFDQMQGWPEPQSCRCRFCRAAFGDFVRSAYRPDQLLERFGFTDLRDIEPPAFIVPSGTLAMDSLVNPLMQDWVRFRAAAHARIFGEYDRFIHSLNPQTALEGNPNLNLGVNRGFRQGVDVGQMLEHGDVVWSEEPNHAQWTSDGRLVSKIRSFKAARIMGRSLFIYTGGRYGAQNPESPPELRLAEAMAYNDRNLGMVGDVSPSGVSLTPAARRYIDFFYSHAADLSGTTTVADAAVLRSFASVEFNPSKSLVSTVLVEQSLIQNRVPFDIIFDRHLKDLSKYKVLVLANQDALSAEQVEAIRAYVRNGGGLVATENSSLLTDWRLRRRAFALADLFGIQLPPVGDAPNRPLRSQFGKGRVVYIPRVEPAVEPPPPQMSYQFDNQYWELPKNSAELVSSVVWAAGERLSAAVTGPPSMTLELARQPASGQLLLHLVNFNFTKPVENVDATLVVPDGFRIDEAVLDTPDGDPRQVLKPAVKGSLAVFRIPRVRVYSLLSVRLGKES